MTTPDPNASPVPVLAPRFADLRNRNLMTRAEAARLFGVPHSTYRAWECGGRVPSGAAERLLDVLETVQALNPDLFKALLPVKVRGLM